MKSYQVREQLHEDLLPHLLLSRGIELPEHETFLAPDFERDSHDPMLLPDMASAVERILAAAKNGEQVAVWSDYDCDGIPGGVLLSEFLRTLGLRITHYIPHRHKEGYGLNVEGLQELKTQGVSLVITVDLGTTDIEPIAQAKSFGVEVIVTDHHLVSGLLPEALVINPKRPESRYPFADLCGAGVAWKLVQGILLKNRPEGFAEGREKWLLDLAGLGTLSDMVPLRGENRLLAYYGLTVMRRGRRPGLAALLKLLRIRPSTLTEDDVGFMVAPRINAASRMDSPAVAARLLAATDGEEAAALAAQLNSINDERKGLVAATVKEANKRFALGGGEAQPVIVMGSVDWRPGILGLVANKLVEAHGKPVCLWGREGGEVVRGSCRGDGEINIVELMAQARDLFEDFGGHHGSGGFSLAQERVHELPGRLAQAYELLRAQAQTQSAVGVDRELDLEEVSRTQQSLRRLSPFGTGFEKPLFIFPGLQITAVRTFGKQQNHLGLSLAPRSLGGVGRVDGIAFFSTPDSFNKKVVAGERADIVGHVELDWRGQPRVRVVDVI